MNHNEIDDRDTKTLSYIIADIENYYADTFLSEELKEIYAGIQTDLAEFRSEIVFRNLDIIEANLGKHNLNVKLTEEENEQILRDVKTPEQLLEEFLSTR